MPWLVQKDGEKYCVHKKNQDGSAGDRVACHDTEEEANAQVRALYAAEDEKEDMHEDDEEEYEKSADLADVQTDEAAFGEEEEPQATPHSKFAVKALGEKRIGAYGILWGDETRRDIDGQWFDTKTADLTAIFDALGKLPFLFHHGADTTLKSVVIGEVDVMVPDETGLWYEARIRESELYEKYVRPLINNQRLFSSSGTLPAAAKFEKTGHIAVWPIMEMTGTHTPAEYRMLEGAPVQELKSAYKSIGIDVEETLKSLSGAGVVEEVDNAEDGDVGMSSEGSEKERVVKAIQNQLLLKSKLLEL